MEEQVDLVRARVLGDETDEVVATGTEYLFGAKPSEQPFAARIEAVHLQMAAAGGLREHLADGARTGQVRVGEPVHDDVRGVGEEVDPCVRSEVDVLVTQQELGRVLGGEWLCPAGHDDGSRQLQQRGQSLRVDRDHPVDRLTAGLRIELLDRCGDGGEVGRHVEVSPLDGGAETSVAREVVGGSGDVLGEGVPRTVELLGPAERRQLEAPVGHGENAPVAHEPSGGTRFRRVS